ncbi:MAG TPA: hypothetical protein VEH50_09940 [Methylomirabilota bacterium]|nr:hypothetical protein [Methylomirabilota bacterium]
MPQIRIQREGTRKAPESNATKPLSPPPCFNFALCANRASVEKRGRSVCRRCAANIAGREYPLRSPSKRCIYRSVIEAVEALDMYEPRRSTGDRNKIGQNIARHPRRNSSPRLV